MSYPNAYAQLLLELTNQARLDPHGEYDRCVTNAPANVQAALSYFSVDLVELKSQFDALTATSALAWNAQLGDAAQAHSELMLAQNTQSHQLSGEADISSRIAAAGYTFSYVGENIYAYADDPYYAHAGFFIDWGSTATGIQTPPGHRDNIMLSSFTEVGVGYLAGEGSGYPNVGPDIVTEDFGASYSYAPVVTGVVYLDNDNDAFYSVGEGQGGASISSSSGSTTSWSAGGYNLATNTGLQTVTFALSGGSSVSLAITLGSEENVKIDFVDGDSFRSSVDAVLGTNGIGLALLGEQNLSAIGNTLGNNLIGNRGDNELSGGSGVDSLYGNAGNDTLDGGSGADYLLGGTGNDSYYVDNTYDLVDEGAVFPSFAGDAGDTDTIYSDTDWFWDTYSVGEKLSIVDGAPGSSGAGSTIVGSIWSGQLIGNSGTNVMFGRGGSDTYRAGDGVDWISLSTLGLTDANAYAGVDGTNTIVVDPRATGTFSYDVIFEFESGKDHVDVSAYGYGSEAEVIARGHDDGLGSSYLALGDGFDYVYMVGLELADFHDGDFLVA